MESGNSQIVIPPSTPCFILRWAVDHMRDVIGIPGSHLGNTTFYDFRIRHAYVNGNHPQLRESDAIANFSSLARSCFTCADNFF